MNGLDRIRAVLDDSPMRRAMAALDNSPGRRAMATADEKAKAFRELVERTGRRLAARARIAARRIALALTRRRAKAIARMRPAPRAPRSFAVRREATHPPGSLGEARTLITALTDAANAPPLLRASQTLARAA